VSSRGSNPTTQIGAQIRFVMIDRVSTKLRTIHRRWSANLRCRAARQPATVQPTQSAESTTLLAAVTGPNGRTRR
jgi:hypothetical protein